jgi:hypothetical protein
LKRKKSSRGLKIAEKWLKIVENRQTNAPKPNSLVENGQRMAKMSKQNGLKCQSATIENVGFGVLGYITIAEIPGSASKGFRLVYYCGMKREILGFPRPVPREIPRGGHPEGFPEGL